LIRRQPGPTTLAGEVMERLRNRDIARYSDDLPTSDTERASGELALYASQSVGFASAVEHVATLVRRLAMETRATATSTTAPRPYKALSDRTQRDAHLHGRP
jgi:hypothetical protein